MKLYVFYATLGCGQPMYPGYLETHVEAPDETTAYSLARDRFRKATDNKYCMIYHKLNEVHHLDRIFRGKV